MENSTSAFPFDVNFAAVLAISSPLSFMDNALAYDNRFYFNINAREKIKVLAISESESDYLNRLFRGDEFDFNKFSPDRLDYSVLDDKNVIVLDNLNAIPSSLQTVLWSFFNTGGTVIIVPSINTDLSSYNSLLSSLSSTRFIEKVSSEAQLTTISFDHPLFQNVFEQQVTNFQYPTTSVYFNVRTNLATALAMDGGNPFLIGDNRFYVFTAPLELANSNFVNSPLIVPTFYNMAQSSLRLPKLFNTLGSASTVDVVVELDNDDILKVTKEGYEFIPLQQSFPARVQLTFDQNPTEDGVYSIVRDNEILQNISFNYPRTESQLKYLDLGTLQNINTLDSIPELFEQLKAENNIYAYWKWFVILALLLALIEVLIQKFVT